MFVRSGTLPEDARLCGYSVVRWRDQCNALDSKQDGIDGVDMWEYLVKANKRQQKLVRAFIAELYLTFYEGWCMGVVRMGCIQPSSHVCPLGDLT